MKNPLLILVIILSLVTFVFSQTTKTLELTIPIEQSISANDVHTYSLKIPANQTAKIEVEQKNLDLTIVGFKPSGEKLLENGIDSGLSKINYVLVNAIEAGDYKLEISTTDKKQKPLSYSIKLTEIRPTTEHDKKIANALNQIFQLFPQANALGKTQKVENVRQAIEKYQQIVDLSKVLQDKSLAANALLQKYFLHLQLTEYPNALETAEHALAIWTELGNKSGQAVLLDKIGIIYNRQNNYQKAIEYYEKALAVAREANSNAVTSILTNLATAYDNSGNPTKAVEFHQQAIVKQRELGFRGEEGRALVNLGLVFYRLSQYDKALESYFQAEILLKEVGDRIGEAALTQNLGLVYSRLGEPRKTLEYYDKALALNQLTGDKRGIALTKANMASTYERLGEYERALELFEEAIKGYREIGNNSEGVALGNLGTLLRNLGDDDQALEKYNQSLAIRQKIKDRRGEAVTLANIGAIFQDRNELTKARENFEAALKIWREVKDRDNESRGLNFLGNVERLEKNYANAIKSYNDSLEISRSLSTKNTEAGTLMSLGLVTELQNEKEKSLDYFTQAAKLYRNLENGRLYAQTLYHQARMKKELAQLQSAAEDIKEAVSEVEKLRERIPSQTFRSSFFASIQQYYELYIEILLKQHELEPNKGLDLLAFEVNERGRSRSLLELLQEARVNIRQGADEKTLKREQELQELINQKALQRTQLLGGKFTPEQKEKADSEISKLFAELEIVRTKLRQESPRYAALTQTNAITTKEIQNLLDEKTVLLEYRLGKNQSNLWLISKNSAKVFSLPNRAEIENVAKSYYETIISRNKADEAKLPELTKKLNDLLLAPVASQISGKQLAIVADGVLQYIPFSVLAEKNEIVMLPSAAVLAELRQKSNAKTPEKTLALFADAVFEANDPRLTATSQNTPKTIEVKRVLRDFNFGENLPRLLASREEARNISALVAKEKSILNTDFEANRENVVNGNLADYQILHFATHGLLDTSRPEFSSLVFSLYDQNGKVKDGFLRLNQVYNLNLNSNLVVLSACQTALGKDIRGEGLVGLTRGFMYAGTKRIVASLWKVDDAATAEFMKRFYQNLLVKKLNPVSSLNQAQNELKQIPRFKNPYYWAGFTIQGDWK